MDKKLRKEIIERDKCCKICGGISRLQVHHIREIIRGEYLNAYTNEIPNLLITLCSKCHHILHKSSGRRKWDIRRKLLLLFNIDIGFCMMPRWIRTSLGITECEYCGVERSKHGIPPIGG